eukprot:scaffold184822_cov15-Tisochrysis_lutea.AAC.1
MSFLALATDPVPQETPPGDIDSHLGMIIKTLERDLGACIPSTWKESCLPYKDSSSSSSRIVWSVHVVSNAQFCHWKTLLASSGTSNTSSHYLPPLPGLSRGSQLKLKICNRCFYVQKSAEIKKIGCHQGHTALVLIYAVVAWRETSRFLS